MDDFNELLENKSNDELLLMVYEYDKWSPEMLVSIETELTKRKILPNDIRSRKEKLMELEDGKLKVGRSASVIGLVIGWLTSFGLLGIFIGYNYSFSKAVNKYSGEKYFKYDESSRKNGTYLFYASIILSTLGLLFRIFRNYSI